jgi:hypothetical protein
MGSMARVGPAEVRERYGVDPRQVPDFIALRGDPSDKLPGAGGVGPKGAADLLRRHGTLDAILTAGRFPQQTELRRVVGFSVADEIEKLDRLNKSGRLPIKSSHAFARSSLHSRDYEITRRARANFRNHAALLPNLPRRYGATLLVISFDAELPTQSTDPGCGRSCFERHRAPGVGHGDSNFATTGN